MTSKPVKTPEERKKNALAAQKSRAKRREYVTLLETRVAELEKTIRAQKTVVEHLRADNSWLRGREELLRDLLVNIFGVDPSTVQKLRYRPPKVVQTVFPPSRTVSPFEME